MLLKFNKPIPIDDARQLYNDSVKFITTTDSYPNVGAIEFSSDPRYIFKRKHVDPKTGKLAEKISTRYEKKIQRIWNRSFKDIIHILTNPRKQEQISITEEQKKLVKDVLNRMQEDLQDSAERPYTDAYKLGLLRGHVISGQEMDDSLTDDDDAAIADQLDDNEQYLAAFSSDLSTDLDKITERPYESYEELATAVKEKIQEPKKHRALLYAAAVFGLVVLGTVVALKRAKEEFGHFKPTGGYWVNHPTEGLGGEVCDGCEENSGHFFTLDAFEEEHGTNQCLQRCRCTLEFRNE